MSIVTQGLGSGMLMESSKKENVNWNEVKYVFIVEGDDEEKFFKEFLKYLGIQDFYIHNCESKDKIKPEIRLLFDDRKFREHLFLKKTIKSLIVIRDAEGNAKGAFESVSNILKNVGIKKLPKKPFDFQNSEICFEEEKVTINIGVVVNNEMLEDLCLESIEKTDAFECVGLFFNCLEKKGFNLKHVGSEKNVTDPTKTIKNPSKAKLQTFLATCSKTYPKLGVAAERGVWLFDHPAFNQIKEFFLKLNNQ